METDRNLLFGVLALQVDLINAQQFAEACALWTAQKEVPLSEVLIKHGWISEADSVDVDRFVERRIQRNKGDVHASLVSSADDTVNRALAQIDNDEILNSFVQKTDIPSANLVTTINLSPKDDDRYELSRIHARGGLGRVWLARDNQLGRIVALKDIRPESAADPAIMTRFLKEAQITGQLEHPGVVPVYELRRRPADQQPFYAMRFVQGKTLREAVQEYHKRKKREQTERSDLVDLLSAFVTVCKTIAYAHSRGVIHRDLKGGNIILGDYGEVNVVDWGLAKLVTQPDEEAVQQPLKLDADAHLTMDGQALGTPAYMAPEQAAGRLEDIDHRTDIYGLGAILYEILTGQPPFPGSTVAEILRNILAEDPIPPTRFSDDVPSNLERICLRALAKRRSDRFQSAGELADGVQQWQEQQRQQAIQELRESEALYQGLVESLPLVIWRKDAEGRFQFVNKGFSEMFGATIDEIRGKTDVELGWGEHAERFRSDDLKVLETGICTEYDEEAVTAEGRTFYSRTFKAPVRNADGDIVGTQGFLWDVTEHKVALDELRNSQAELKRYRAQLENRKR